MLQIILALALISAFVPSVQGQTLVKDSPVQAGDALNAACFVQGGWSLCHNFPTTDGGIIWFGMAPGRQGWMLKLNGNNKVVTQALFGGGGNDYFYSGGPTYDSAGVANGYVGVGLNRSSRGSDASAWLVQTDLALNKVFERTYPFGKESWAEDVKFAPGFGYEFRCFVINADGSKQNVIRTVDLKGELLPGKFVFP